MTVQDQDKVKSDQFRSKSSQGKSDQIRPRSGQGQIRIGYVKDRTGQDMLDLVMTWYRRSVQVRSTHVGTGHVRSGQFRTGQFMFWCAVAR